MNSENFHYRRIRSFVLREGRMTAGQQRALDELWPRYGIEPEADKPLNFNTLFARTAPVVLEIGFGNGESLAAMAIANPDYDFVGIEVHKPGVGHLLQLLEKQAISNVRALCRDAVDVLSAHVADNSLQQLNLFFPDPWPKKRHHKRRLVQPDFVSLLAGKLKPGGLFHVATDWEDYMRHVEEIMAAADDLFMAVDSDQALQRPNTKFERRGLKLGHGVWDRVYRKR